MLQLIYTSISTGAMPAAGLDALCEHAARNNRRDEITGVLLLNGDHFLQVLEGPRELVENTFLRIVVDDRHHDLLLLGRKMETAREFGAWSMAKYDDAPGISAIVERVRGKLIHAPDHLRRAFEARFPPRHGGSIAPAAASI